MTPDHTLLALKILTGPGAGLGMLILAWVTNIGIAVGVAKFAAKFGHTSEQMGIGLGVLVLIVMAVTNLAPLVTLANVVGNAHNWG